MFITRRIPLFLLAPDEPAGSGGTPPEEGTPTPLAGTGTEQQPATQENWEDRYKEAQAWGTRNAQRAAELEADAQLTAALRSDDPELQRQALIELGYPDPYEDTQPDNGLDPEIAARLAKVDELEQQWNTRTQQEQEQANYASYRQQYDPELTQMGVPEDLHDFVADLAYNHIPPVQTPQGQKPDLAAAMRQVEQMAERFAVLPNVQTAVKKSWQKTKPSAAVTQPGGVQATHTQQLDSRAKRADFISQQLAQLDADDQAGA